jgi:hypothetical protein
MAYFPTPLYGLHGRAMPAGSDSTFWGETLNSSPYQPGDPRSIDGLQLYTDAYALNGSLGYLDSVASWPDWSGLNRTVEQSVGGSQPRFLPWSAAEGNYLHLPRVVGNHASTPNSSALQITGDIDIRADIAPLDWSGVGTQGVVTKRLGSSNISYHLSIENNGSLSARFSSDGSFNTGEAAFSSESTGFAGGLRRWVRVTRSATTGDVMFFTSVDGVAWTQLGTTQSTNPGNIYDGTAEVRIGANAVNDWYWAGRAFYAEIRNGIDGPVVARFDPNRANANSSSFVSDTGETWTINRTAIANAAQIVSAPAVMFDGTDDFLNVTTGLDMLRNVPGATMIATFAHFAGEGSNRLAAFVSTGANAESARLSLLRRNSNQTGGGVRRLDADTILEQSVAHTLTQTAIFVNRAEYAAGTQSIYRNGAIAIGPTSLPGGAGNSSDTDSLAISLGANGVGNLPMGGTLRNSAIFNRALTDAEIRGVSRFLARRARAGITVA